MPGMSLTFSIFATFLKASRERLIAVAHVEAALKKRCALYASRSRQHQLLRRPNIRLASARTEGGCSRASLF